MTPRAAKTVLSISSIRRLETATPVPFVGRTDELATLTRAVTGPEVRTVTVIRGPAGAGKTRLADELASTLAQTLAVTSVSCQPGDRAIALTARAERYMGILPGDLATHLNQHPALLVFDDLHLLADSEAERLITPLVEACEHGRLLLVTRDMPPLRRDVSPLVIDLGGISIDAAQSMWAHLEACYGAAASDACERAYQRTRGLPLALRRAYAEAIYGARPWADDRLSHDAQMSRDVLAVLGRPASPAAVSALLRDIDDSGDSDDDNDSDHGDASAASAGLAELAARQLVDVLACGRYRLHSALRFDTRDAIPAPRRRPLERAAAGRIATSTANNDGRDISLGVLDPVDRLCAEIGHLCAAEAWDEALHCLQARYVSVLERGGSGEIEGLLARLAPSPAAPPKRPEQRALLATISWHIARRRGDINRALALDPGTDPVATAALRYRAGSPSGARQLLEDAAAAPRPQAAQAVSLAPAQTATEARARTAALLSEIHLASGDIDAAEHTAVSAFERDHALVSDQARAELHLALAAVEVHRGRLDAARAALARAAGAGRIDAALRARVEARQAACMIGEGRLRDAADYLDRAEQSARAIDAVAVADEIRLYRSRLQLERGHSGCAVRDLGDLIERSRRRGDEFGALRAEIALAEVMLRRGERAQAAERARIARRTAVRIGLASLATRAACVAAAVDAADLHSDARDQLAALGGDPAACAETRARAAEHRARLSLALAEDTPNAEPNAEPNSTANTNLQDSAKSADAADDHLSAALVRAKRVATRDRGQGLELANRIAIAAARAERRGDLADALALAAQLELSAGTRARAKAAASRAIREGEQSGLWEPQVIGHLVSAGLAHADNRQALAVEHLRMAASISQQVGLTVLSMVAIEALSGADASAAPSDCDAARATLSPAAARAANRIAADLGLSAARPYVMLSASGQRTRIADTEPERLGLSERGLVIDRVRELMFRNGQQIANLRRRSLLKKLLYLFAAAPGQTFSKEDIVETVWGVEYHPLRHDAALFTNIMRARRLLGDDGAELIRVSDDGYRLVPPADFLYIEAAAEAQ